MKICSLYGAGFYYIPGTDTCIKVGGWVRMQMGNNYGGDMSHGTMVANANNRNTNDFVTRNRGYITADARSQTEYGTLRSYIAVGISADNEAASGNTSGGSAGSNAGGFSANRAFISFAGFTAGRAQSFYDFTDNAALSYNGASIWNTAATTGDAGAQVLAYTAQLGGGLSATVAVEKARNNGVLKLTTGMSVATALLAAQPTAAASDVVGSKYPDIVGNLRIDQAWGSAQVMGALHNASAGYYTLNTPSSGHPGDKMGYAVSVGVKINLPMLGNGDYIDIQGGYALGASGYLASSKSYGVVHGGDGGFGLMSDGVFGATGDVQLTKTAAIFGGYQHNWNPKVKTSVYGGYLKTTYNDAANTLAGNSANMTWSDWQLGTRTAWAPVSNLEVGLDVMYSRLNTMDIGTTATAVATNHDQSAWTTHLRIQRNFYP